MLLTTGFYNQPLLSSHLIAAAALTSTGYSLKLLQLVSCYLGPDTESMFVALVVESNK